MWSVGLDVHQRTSTLCILDENGKKVKQATVRGGLRHDCGGYAANRAQNRSHWSL